MTNSYSKTDLLKETLRVAWPSVLESFFVSLAGMIDTLMVSSLGTYAVAAVGLTTQPKFIGLALFICCTMSVSALVARRRGQDDRRNANEILLTALTYVVIMSILVAVVSVFGANTIIRWAGSNADTHNPSVTYFRIIQGGTIFNVLSLCINAAQRGSGNTKIAMTTNVTSSIVNVLFNYLLINGHFGFPKWRLFGAAIATVFGTVIACAMSFRSLFQPNSYVSIPYMIQEHIRPRFQDAKSIYKLAYNLLLENLAMRIGFVYTALIAARLGTDPFAAHNVGMNFLSLGFAFGDGMQAASIALIGRSLGEKDPDKAKTYGSLCQRVGLCMSCCLAILLFCGGKTMFSYFFDEPNVLNMGVMITRFIMVTVLFQISQVIFGGSLRAAGDVRYTLVASLISVTFIRTFATWVFTTLFPLGLAGIWIGILADQMSRFTLLGLRFRQGKWVELKI